jgi:hypothetical protein
VRDYDQIHVYLLNNSLHIDETVFIFCSLHDIIRIDVKENQFVVLEGNQYL